MRRKSDRVAYQIGEARRACVASGLFDSDWYLAQNPDVAAAGLDPLDHFIAAGAAEGRDPNPLFDCDWYLQQYPEVASAGHNPLVDYAIGGIEAGRDPNPFFSSRWYLSQNRDVAASGINPLTHYLRWGSARGLDPSPLFDTDWYLERNPDVMVAGVNPLEHYLKWGQAEKREPVSPIPGLYESLAKRPANIPEDFARLSSIYLPPLEMQPELTGADNNIVVGVVWAEHFMSSSLGLHARGEAAGALRFAKYAAQTLPDEDDPMQLYCQLFAQYNHDSIEEFARSFSAARLIVLHVSHKAGLESAEASCRTFFDPSGCVANLIVVGDALPEDTFRFDRARSILYVPAPDTYEALPQKVGKSLLFLGMSPLSLPILKVDDDASCQDLDKLLRLVDEVITRHPYGGRVNPRAGTASCAFWHFGKCTDENINQRPDGLLWLAPYAGGQGYWLNGKVTGAMAKICILHERYLEVEHYEDRAVGTLLAQYGIRPYHFDVIAAGIVSDCNQPQLRDKRPVAQLRGARSAS